MRIKTLLMMSAALALSAAAVMTVPPAQRAYGFAEPSSAPQSWQFDFSHGKPAVIAVKTVDGVKWFWYLTYKVENNTGDDRLFIPEIVMSTDEGDIVTAGKNVPAGVYDAIKQRLGNKLLDSPIRVVGRLLQGADNARESVAIWPAFDHDIDQMSIFISGIGGESEIIKNPLTGDSVTVVKTLMARYSLPGTGGRLQDQAVVTRGETWVMR